MPAATIGTSLEAANAVGEPNPNNMYRRRRTDAYKAMSLTMKQEQAAKLLRDAYCRADALSSGGELKEQVQSSPKPDAAVTRQCEVMSHLVYVTKTATPMDKKLFDHVLRRNLPIRDYPVRKPDILMKLFKIGLDRVARHMRY